MTMTLTATKTAPDAYDFTIASLLPAESPTFAIEYGDGTAPVTVNTNASGTTVVHHVYAVAGHHDYTVTVTASKTPLARTLAELATAGQSAQSLWLPSVASTGSDVANIESGVKITPLRSGLITAIKFYKVAAQTSTSRDLTVYDDVTKAVLYRQTTSNEPATGWMTVPLTQAVPVVAGKRYLVTYRGMDRVLYGPPMPADQSPDLRVDGCVYHYYPNYPDQPTPNGWMEMVDVVYTPYAQSADQSLFPDTLGIDGSTAANFEMGQKFTPKRAGRVTAFRWYKPPSDALTGHPFSLWRVSDQAKLGTVTSTGETGTGWKRADLATPVAVVANTEYVASVTLASGTMSYRFGLPPASISPDLTTGRGCQQQPPGQYPAQNSGDMYMMDVVYRADASLSDLAALPGWPTLGSWAATTQTATTTASVDVGPATIWATVIPGTPVPTVQVDAYVSSGQNIIGWEVTRDADGKSTTIYVGSAWQQAASFVDELAPLGVPVVYRLRITYSDYTAVAVSSAPVIITGTVGCYLTDPNTGDTIAVTLVTWPEREREARRAVLGVLNRADPVALSDQHLTPAGDWTFYTTTDPDTRALIALLTASTFATLRTQPGSSIASVTVSVGNVNERRYSGAGGDARRFVDVEVQEIEPLPATALPLNATLGGLATVDGDTLGKLSQFRDTLLQLSMVVTGVSTSVGGLDAFNV